MRTGGLVAPGGAGARDMRAMTRLVSGVAVLMLGSCIAVDAGPTTRATEGATNLRLGATVVINGVQVVLTRTFENPAWPADWVWPWAGAAVDVFLGSALHEEGRPEHVARRRDSMGRSTVLWHRGIVLVSRETAPAPGETRGLDRYELRIGVERIRAR